MRPVSNFLIMQLSNSRIFPHGYFEKNNLDYCIFYTAVV